MRVNAAESLGEIGNKAAVPRLIEVLKKKDQWVGVRQAAAEALGQIGDQAAVLALTEALKGEELEMVRHRITEALKKLGGEN